MNLHRVIILACFVILIGVPMVFRPGSEVSHSASGQVDQLIIITPHNEQIRYEFKRAFERWHMERFNVPVEVVYNVPGGTSEIRKMLESQFVAAIESGSQPGGDADLVFGGGTFEHSRLKRGVTLTVDGQPHTASISVPMEFSDQWLLDTFGENRIGDDRLYDPDKHWFGLALSGFGIVFNNHVLQQLNITPPKDWVDLCDPRLQGWVALVNPNQSGSVTTAFESIFKRVGWQEGWRILRRAGANARYFSASSLKPPIDVSQGNAAMGVCIDFFGRFQSQALKDAGDAGRIGYIDPPGVPLDADPISMLRNAPHPELAKRFIEFCLSEQGQALWQFPKRSALLDVTSAEPAYTLHGPDRFELRRMPIVRSMYEQHFDHFTDMVNPFELAQPANFPDQNFRDFIAPLFAAIAMDTHHNLKAAWNAIVTHPAYPTGDVMVTADDVTDPTLRMMLHLFDAMPTVAGPGGSVRSLEAAEALGAIRSGWLQRGWAKHRLWPDETSPADELRRRFGDFFRANYQHILALAEGDQRAH